MLSEAIRDLLPAAIAVALSPIPVVAVVLVVQGPRARTVGPAFASGWLLGLTTVSVAVLVVAGGADDPTSDAATGVGWMKLALGIAFFVMAARQWAKRPRAGAPPAQPGWMAQVDELTPARGFVLGLAVSAANPKNLALTLAAAASIAQAGLGRTDTVVAVMLFVAIGSLTVAGTVLFALVAPHRAERPLATLRQFMADNNAVIMMVVLVLLGAKLLGDGLAGVWN